MMVGDAGDGGEAGAVPAPGAGDAEASKYLKAAAGALDMMMIPVIWWG